MSNEKLQASIQRLDPKIKALLKDYEEKQELIRQLKKENSELRSQAIGNRTHKGDFLSKVDFATISRNETRAIELRSSIDAYIKSIDKSIAYFEQFQ